MKTISFLAALFVVAAAHAAETRPVVVELFTSQGCSSCPPADKLLGELAKRNDVIALGFHITYWDGAAWRDPFSLPQSTERQVAYDRHLTGGQIYTPQMVIDGTADVVGSDRTAVLAAIGAVKPVAVAPVRFAADRRSVAIGAGAAPAGASIVLARYALARTTHIGGGENADRTATDFNGVEQLRTLGTWDGKPVNLAIEPPGEGEGIVVLVQAPDGTILGAAALSS
ncbi:MAG TPA: DUF1223 domain-containing protein [Stellaceae bacterium]|nr:DUF1223 domain-containing protein [Stellaceae bacterium]